MKNTTLKVLATVLIGMGALVASMPARAQSNGVDAVYAAANETANAGFQVGGADVTKGVNLFFTGKTKAGAQATSTGAYVTISATAMTFYQPYGTVDANVGAAGVVTYASTLGSNTMGSLCDYLNGLGYSYRCLLQGAKRDDPPKILTTQTETDGTRNLAASGGASITITTTTFVSLGITPGVGKRVVLSQCTGNGNMSSGDNGLSIYGQLRKYGVVAPIIAQYPTTAGAFAHDPYGTVADDTYLVWQSTNVANTDTTKPVNAQLRWIEFAQGAHVVVREGNTNSTSVQGATNGVSCAWMER